MEVKVQIRKVSGSPIEELSVISFSFKKNLYQPYTMLNVVFMAENNDYMSVNEVLLYIDGKLIHHGIVDTFEVFDKNGVKTGKVTSRGFTSLLMQNQIEPGIKSNISLNSLMDSYYDIDYITHENNSNTENYIYVQKNSTMWDGIVTLAYKLCGTYPFIESDNCVRITPKDVPLHFDYSETDMTAYGLIHDFSGLISNFDMPDIEGNYGTYTLEDSNVTNKKIVRHKYMDFDEEFVHNPQEALEFRRKTANKSRFCYYCEYNGYRGEDLTDTASFKYVTGKKISLIEIKGSSKGVFTRIGVYYDDFHY